MSGRRLATTLNPKLRTSLNGLNVRKRKPNPREVMPVISRPAWMCVLALGMVNILYDLNSVQIGSPAAKSFSHEGHEGFGFIDQHSSEFERPSNFRIKYESSEGA